jgi:DNA-binding transcriptional regulator YdaS (Cro superfamily)
MSEQAIQKAIDAAGGQSALARLISTPDRKVSQGHVWAWLKRDKKVPAEYVLAIEAACKGQVTRHALRPDVFGPPPKEEAPHAA